MADNFIKSKNLNRLEEAVELVLRKKGGLAQD